MTTRPSFPAHLFATSGQRRLGLALSQCMALDVLELVDPAAGAADDLKAATATVASVVTWTAADLKTAGKTKLALHGARALTFTTAGTTESDAPANVVITGLDVDGNTITETLALAQTAAAVTSVRCYASITSLVFPAADGTGATIAVGISDKFGFLSEVKQRSSGASVLAELIDGDVVGTGGAAATAVNQAATTKQAGHAHFVAPIAAELVTIVADVLLADGAQIIAAQPDYPRKLQVRITDGDTSISAGIATIIGVGAGGEALTEDVDLTGGTATKVTTLAYATVTSITVSGLVGNDGADNIGVGVGAALGLPVPASATGLAVHKTVMDEADEAVAGVDQTAQSVAPTTAPNAAHDYHFFYSYDLAHNHTQNSHSHTGAEGEGAFVSPATSAPYGAYTPATTPDGSLDFLVIYERVANLMGS